MIPAMKLQLVLILVVVSIVQASPLHERNPRRRRGRKASNEEVRSIISAIVDAVLDGDRKRRSEVVDFDDESAYDGSQTTASLKNLKGNEVQRKFTKREQREADDNSVPLADVIATSDVKSKDDQTKTVKKDVIQHSVDEKLTKNNAPSKGSNADEPNDGKAKRKSSVGKALSKPSTQKGPTQSKKTSIDDHAEPPEAKTYAEFLQDTKIPKHTEKHDDDMEMTEHSPKSSSSKNIKKFQDSMETERNDRMEDSKSDDDSMESNGHAENYSEDDSEDKSEDESEGKSEDESENDSQDESDDETENHSEGDDSEDDNSKDKSEDDSEDDNSEDKSEDDSEDDDKSMDDNGGAKNTDDSEMNSEDNTMSGRKMTSEKTTDKQSGEKVESETKSTQDLSNEKDNSEMDDSDEEPTTENTNNSAGPKGSDSMDSGITQGNDINGGSEAPEHADHSLYNKNLESKTGGENNAENLKAETETDSSTGDNTASKAGNDSNIKDLNAASTASEDNSVIKIGDETNAKGLDAGSANIDSISSQDKSDLHHSVLGDASESKVTTGPKPILPDESNVYYSGEDQDLKENNETEEFNDLDTGSSSGDSNIENTALNNEDEKEVNTILNNVDQRKVHNNEAKNDENKDAKASNLASESGVAGTEAPNDNMENNKQDVMQSTPKPGQTEISAVMNGKEDITKEMEDEKNSPSKDEEVKAGEGGKIIETSYRFNDDDAPDDDDYVNQANDIWTGNPHHDPLLTADDTSDPNGNEDLQVQPEDLKDVNNLHISGKDLYEDGYNSQNSEPENWGDDKTKAPPQSDDYNWIMNGLKSNQNLQNIQDQMQDYQNADWNGKDTPYLGHGGSQEDQTTEQPELERRTIIPTIKSVRPQYTTAGNKLPKQHIKRKQYTTTTDALTDNDVYGYTGSIGPFLQKRNFVPQTLESRPALTKKDDILESLITDVNEPWIKHFLAKSLKMAVNGEKGILTSDQDGYDDKGTPATRRDGVSEVDSDSKTTKENKEDDDMPLDATNEKDDSGDDVGDSESPNSFIKDTDSDDSETTKNNAREKAAEREESEDETQLPTIHQDIPNTASTLRLEGIPLSEVLRGIPKPESSQSPVADIGTVPSKEDGPLKSVIRITERVPVDHHEQTEAIPSTTERVDHRVPDQSESLPSTASQVPVDYQISEQSGPPQLLQQQQQPSQIQQITSSTPQLPSSTLPQQPDIPIEPPPAALPVFPGSNIATTANQTTDVNQPTDPRPLITSSNQAAPAVIGPIIKIITAPGKKVTIKLSSKDQERNANKEMMKFESEIKNALNKSIQNIGISSSNDVLKNTIKEAELIHVLKDAIPVNQRRPVGIENDLKQGLDDLKDYAVALTEATGLSQSRRDDVAAKLARDLLDEMRVIDGKKQELLKQLMSFVTATEVATFKERLNEIKSQIIQLSAQNPDDMVKIRSTAIKLLDELFEQLPLPKEQIQKTEKKVGDSKLLRSILQRGEKRVLRSKLKKALIDLVADKLL